MTALRIDTDDGRRWFLPGDTVSGRVSWSLEEPCETVELRLFWHTSGKGTEDVEIVDTAVFSEGGAHGDRAFSFDLPLGPYSFSGTLITLTWALELVALPAGDVARAEITVAPTPVEVRLEGLGRAPRGFSLDLTPGRGNR
jgi:hypothetical protein